MDLITGLMICSKCNGIGFINKPQRPGQVCRCPKCQGNGKLDWIENIVGKKFYESWFHGQPEYGTRNYYKFKNRTKYK